MITTNASKGRLEITQTIDGEAALLKLKGAIDETFTGFDPPAATQVVLELSGLTRITSYGVRQWIRGRDLLSQSAKQLYYLNCPPFFIDQLNMVLNFGGHGQVVTASVPYTCPNCKNEKWALVDVMARHDELSGGNAPPEKCEKCQTPMQMDELPETFFGFVKQGAARSLSPQVSTLLQAEGLYRGAGDAAAPAPSIDRTQVRKLVHERVTYFRIIGAIDKRFRARSLLEGTEGEVVLDLRELGNVSEDGVDEWNRLRTGMKERASLVTFVDVPPAVLDVVGAGKLSLGSAVVYSILAPHKCDACGRTSDESIVLASVKASANRVCSACGGASKFAGKKEHLQLSSRFVSGPILAASREVIERRDDLLSRARIDAEAAPAPSQKKSGTILGKYEIARALSVGGMAEVFLAVQKGIGGFEKPVALKRIRRTILERRHFAVEQFLNEAKIAATLAHPNIAQIFDVGEEDGILYLAMEYVHGKDLRVLGHRIKNKNEKLPLASALYIVREVARALHHAYTTLDLNGRQLKAIHRDVSPHNILVGFDGSVKLVDFGVATSATTGHDPTQVAGKQNYMSPEQLQGQSLDARSDLFALGSVFYELITGERPFARDSRDETLNAISEGRYTPATQLRPDLPPAVDQLLEKLLAVKPSDRYSDGNRVAEEIAAFAARANLAIGPEWLRVNMASMFPSTDEPDPEHPAAHTYTPRSDSFSLEPTFSHGPVRGGTAAAEGPVKGGSAAKVTPSRGVGYISGSLAALDEQTLSQIVNPVFTKKMRVGTVLILLVMIAFLVFLWWRY